MEQLYDMRRQCLEYIATCTEPEHLPEWQRMLAEIEAEIRIEEALGFPCEGRRIVFAPGDEPF